MLWHRLTFVYGSNVEFSLRRNDRPRWQQGVLGDDHDAVAHHPILGIQLSTQREGANDHTRTDAHILIQDGALDVSIGSNTERNASRRRCARGVVVVGAHHDGIAQAHPAGDVAAQPDDRVAGEMRQPSAASRKQKAPSLGWSLIRCRRRESNPHSFRNTILSRARLPIPSLRQICEALC
jgi:hypothetical protein